MGWVIIFRVTVRVRVRVRARARVWARVRVRAHLEESEPLAQGAQPLAAA